MSIYLLTKEQVEELRKHPYVANATQRCVIFTSEFKKIVYNELERGKTIVQICEEAELPTGILGKKRLANLQLTVEKHYDTGFADKRESNHGHKAQSTEAQLEKKLRQMEHRIAYLEQENDFLKKIGEAQKELQSKAVKSNCRRK